jgi:hypothetical protein
MNKLLLTTVIGCCFLMTTASLTAEERKSGFGFGMGSGTPERSGRNYGWGFGPTDDYRETESGIEQSTASGGMSWGDGNRRYRNSRPFFSFGSSRDRYGPPPGWGYYPPPGWGYYPPPPQYAYPPVDQQQQNSAEEQ